MKESGWDRMAGEGLRNSKMSNDELSWIRCDQSFRFRPGPVFQSEEKVTILGRVKTEGGQLI